MPKRKQKVKPRILLKVSTYSFADIDIERAVCQLPERDRVITILHLQGHTQAEIATILKLSETTISIDFRRIKRNLAGVLDENDSKLSGY